VSYESRCKAKKEGGLCQEQSEDKANLSHPTSHIA
jgi:hypothetical protein